MAQVDMMPAANALTSFHPFSALLDFPIRPLLCIIAHLDGELTERPKVLPC